MLVISILSDNLCLHRKPEKTINDRAIFVIVMVGRYGIYDRQNVLASNISLDRPIWTWILVIEK